MASSLFLLLIIIIIIIVPLRQVASTSVVFDYYVLALTWPNSFCKLKQSSPMPCLHPDQTNLPQIFTIHGLWPSRFGGDAPTNCSKEVFQFKLLGTLTKGAATKKWPDLKKSVKGKTKAQDSSGFWKSQWDKHGVCSNLVPDAYMDLAMNLYDKVSTEITSAMRSHPHGGTVNIVDFTAAIEKLVKKKPRLVCQINPKGQLLSEIQFYVDKSKEFTDAGNSNCDPSIQVQFP